MKLGNQTKNIQRNKYGHLLVVGYLGKDKTQNAVWECLCDCGNVVSVRGTAMMGKRKQSYCSHQCGLLTAKIRADITGKDFGELTAIERVGIDKGGKSLWLFNCSCGNQKVVTADRVMSGNSKTCGMGIHYPGRKHGLARTTEMKNAWSKAYQTKKVFRVPSWVTQEDLDVMVEMYKEAKAMTVETGVPHEVDHIYPLQGKLVSGLHVPNNLRVIPRVDNRKKSNKLIEEVC